MSISLLNFNLLGKKANLFAVCLYKLGMSLCMSRYSNEMTSRLEAAQFIERRTQLYAIWPRQQNGIKPNVFYGIAS